MVDQMESIRETHEQFEKLKKALEAKKEILEKRHEILVRMNSDLKSGNKTPSIERTNRLEGYYSHIILCELEDLIEGGNWFVGVVLSAAILEDVGKRKLKRTFKDKIDSKKIEHLTFEQTIMMLLASGVVDAKIYQKLMEVRKVRNDMAHDSNEAMSTFLQTGSTESKDCQKCKSVIKKAIFCLKKINPPITP
jgi:hypothetical protein